MQIGSEATSDSAEASRPRASLRRLEAVPERTPACPLTSVLASSEALGARRLTALAVQLARELEIAEMAGVSLRPITLDDVVIENAGSSRERARLVPVLDAPERGPDNRAQLARLGALIDRIIADKPLFLEDAVWVPPGSGDDRVRRRRADADVLRSLARALSLIAQRCQGGPTAYASLADLSRDLDKLSLLTERIVARRRAPAPIVSIAHPRPRHAAGAPLPKVIVDGATACRAKAGQASSPVGALSKSGEASSPEHLVGRPR